jgi:hypothetical protein
MPCDVIRTPGGATVFACSRGRRPPPCTVPGCDRPGVRQCDYPVPARRSGTCDRYLCAAHAVSRGPNRDLCPPHAKLEERQGKLPLGEP